jgi:hypothetical protein
MMTDFPIEAYNKIPGIVEQPLREINSAKHGNKNFIPTVGIVGLNK